MKLERHSKIVELIGKYEIETQEELAEHPKEEGYQVTQATISRDIRELKLTKASGENGRQRYMVMQTQETLSDKYIRILRDGFVSMDMAQNILVIKTVSGMAMAVAAALDAIHFHETESSHGLYFLYVTLLFHKDTQLQGYLFFPVHCRRKKYWFPCQTAKIKTHNF